MATIGASRGRHSRRNSPLAGRQATSPALRHPIGHVLTRADDTAELAEQFVETFVAEQRHAIGPAVEVQS